MQDNSSSIETLNLKKKYNFQSKLVNSVNKLCKITQKKQNRHWIQAKSNNLHIISLYQPLHSSKLVPSTHSNCSPISNIRNCSRNKKTNCLSFWFDSKQCDSTNYLLEPLFRNKPSRLLHCKHGYLLFGHFLKWRINSCGKYFISFEHKVNK